MPEKTPLYDWHNEHAGKMVDFAGYWLPVQYETGIIKEHKAVRESAGLFDVSHMGEFRLRGPKALDALQNLVTNDCSQMYDGQVKYSPMCNERGGTVDDLLIYRKAADEYMIVVNASNMAKDFDHMSAHMPEGAEFVNESAATAMIALQGPKSKAILSKLCAEADFPTKYYSFRDGVIVAGVKCLLSRTGYTGEMGFELYVGLGDAVPLWEAIMDAGQAFGLIPCGLGARDTLRLEAAMPLYGHEMDEDVSPLEAGLGFFVNMDKGGFIGREALAGANVTRKRVGLKMLGKSIARQGAAVFVDGKPAGAVTSGAQSITLGFPVAMASVDIVAAESGGAVTVDIRGNMMDAEYIELPFYKRPKTN